MKAGERQRDVEPLLAFVAAIVAIAITLLIPALVELAPDVHDSGDLAGLLRERSGELWSFWLGFYVIARSGPASTTPCVPCCWADRRLTVLSLAWSTPIVVLPLPTALVATAGHQAMTEELYLDAVGSRSQLPVHEADDRHEHLGRRSDAEHRRIDMGTRSSCDAGAPDEDRSGGFERFGWAPPLLDDEASTFIGRTFQRADGCLFGRRTCETFAGSWGTGMDPGDALNARRKYVAYTTLTDPRWTRPQCEAATP